MLRRRNLLKRVLPILLSLAMMLQSVPMTAMAAELPVAATAEEADAATEPAEETEAVVEPTEETDAAVESTEDADAAESATQPEEDATVVDDAAAEDGVQSDETAENTGEQPDAVTEEDGAKSDDAAEDSESKPETVKKPVAETETEVAANGVVKEGVAKIIVNDTDVDPEPWGFTRKLGESGLVFVGEYVDVEDSRVGDFQECVKYWLDIEVDGEEVYELKNSLTYSWAKVDGEKREPLVDAMPVDAGTYELTIALDVTGTNGLCTKVEPEGGVKLTLTIEKAKINIWPDTWTQPGKTVGDLIDKNNEDYQIVYADRLDKIEDKNEYAPRYTVSRDIIKGADKKLPIHVYMIDESGARQDLTETPELLGTKFDSTKDYILTIEPESDLLTDDAMVNYELALDDFWKINVGERQDTWIKFERKLDENGGLKDLVEEYEEGKTYSIEDVTKDLFTETGAPAVYTWDDKEDKEVDLKDAVLVPAWYTRIQLEQNDKRLSENEKYKPDEDAGEFQYEWKDEAGKVVKDDFIYKPMKENETPTDAGEYYIVWSYAGDEGAYLKSRSDAIRFTIDPAPVVVNIDLDGVVYTEGKGAQLGFADGMTADDVRKTLAEIAYGVNPIVENQETGALEPDKTKSVATPGFFGTSYGIEDDTNMTQYFVPEFVLQRRPVKMTEKDGNVVDIDERTVDWKTVNVDTSYLDYIEDSEIESHYKLKEKSVLSVVVDEFADAGLNEEDDVWFDAVDKTELPQGADSKNLESVEFKFRVFFTGNKVVYSNRGYKKEYSTLVTDVTTNAANRNYLADITKSRLEASAVLLDVATAVPTTINTDAIVKEFTDAYSELNEVTEDKKLGTLSNPAVKIYDQKGLFEKRSSYKQAEVFDIEASKPVTTNIKGTDERLDYSWSYISLTEYEEYLETWDEDQRKYKDFDDYYYVHGETWGWTNVKDGTFEYSKRAGVYRLTVKFNDKDLAYRNGEKVYRSAEAEVFFKVEQQEVVIVPTKPQYYADKDNNINSFSVSCNSLEIKKDYSIYKIPNNNEDSEVKDGKSFKAFLNEKDYASLVDYEIPTDDALNSYKEKKGKTYDPLANGEHEGRIWKVLRKVKDTAGNDTNDWVEVEDDEYNETFDDDYVYSIAAIWKDGTLYDLDDEAEGANYTTVDVAKRRATGEETHHKQVGEVGFYDGKIYVEIDEELIKALGHEYDGTPFGTKEDGTAITLADVDITKIKKAIKLYTDSELKNLLPDYEKYINTTDEYDPAKINIYWTKKYNDDDYYYSGEREKSPRYVSKNAVYGGIYGLVLRFEGGVLATEETAQDDGTESKVYAPLGEDGWWKSYNEGYDAEFTITPREIIITPELTKNSLLKAGDRANNLVSGNLKSGKEETKDGVTTVVKNILPDDEKFFNYVELSKGYFDAAWNGTSQDGMELETPNYGYEVGNGGGYPAFAGHEAEYVIQVDGKEIQYESDYLRFGKTYTVKLQNALVSPLKESYRVTYAPETVDIINRGNADVTVTQNSELSAGRIDYTHEGTTYTVMPRGAVKFYYSKDAITVNDRYGEGKKLENTNVLGFRIWAPKEFLSDPDFDGSQAYTEKFVYQNAVWNAGGYFLNNDAVWQNGYNIEEKYLGYYIDVVFPLTKDNLDLSFNITWENDYTETFKLAGVVLEEDLTKAVVPKSMAFNGVATKMAVGERQQLNLKITKAQLGDVIAVRYRIKGTDKTYDDKNYISLDPETGALTALKASGKDSITIEAYAVYKDAKGNFVEAKDEKGKPKVASTKIKVTDVTASTIKKIVAQGTSAKVYYTVPDNGFRREVYVVDAKTIINGKEAKKCKAADFNIAIEGINNGQWKTAGFAIAPQYSYAKNVPATLSNPNRYDSKLKAHILTLDGLKAENEYVVYVRNVSAVRELDDGSVVTFSANGAVKKAKTTKPQIERLKLDFTVKTDPKDKTNNATHPVKADGKVDTNKWTVELSAKKTQLNVYGYFSDTDPAAESQDELRYPLVPTSKDSAVKTALKNYQMPKLEYAIYDEYSDTDEPFKPGQKQSKYATINKKGLISLKGVDLNGEVIVKIYVRDNMKHQNDYDADDSIELTITAKATSYTGKKVKAVVGQEIRLVDCLTYKDGKKTIANYRSGSIQITPEMKNAAAEVGFSIENKSTDNKRNDWYITAEKPNAKFDLTVNDYSFEKSDATIQLTSKKMDPVKGLKVTYVDDKHITINFTHAANMNEWDNGGVYQYAFEIKDARGNVVEKKILSVNNVFDECDIVNAKQLKSAQSWIQYSGMDIIKPEKLKDKQIQMNGYAPNELNYYTGTNAKTKTFAYTYTSEKLVRLSSYTISVTPLYGNLEVKDLKTATTKTKTTNIPASYQNPDLTGPTLDRFGGAEVVVTTTANKQQGKNLNDKNDNTVEQSLTDPAGYWFTSGNTYTLKLSPQRLGINDLSTDNEVPRDRMTDTLTWKSSNTKVATIKANAGTYTATFKPVNQGETTITVTSKVTKKVIARWAVKVRAIGDGTSYGGDYEPTWDEGFYENILALYDPYYDGPVEVLSMNLPLTITNDGTWVSFTAPHYGMYTFSGDTRNENEDGWWYGNPQITFYDGRDGSKIGYVLYKNGEREQNQLFLEANQKVYFKVGRGELTVTGTELARLTKANTKDNPLEVKQGHVAFTAEEDNVYTFWLNGTKVLVDDENVNSPFEARMNAGDTWYVWAESDGKMYVTYPDLGKTSAATLDTPFPVTLNWKTQEKYVSYTANVAGGYTFKYVIPADDSVAYSISNANGRDQLDRAGEPVTSVNEKDNTMEVTENYYLEAGQKVVVKFEAKSEITDKEKTLTASVTVSAPTREKVKEDGTITIKKGTTEIVEYVLPANAFMMGKAQFKFDVENGGKIRQYLNKDYKNLADIELEDLMKKEGIEEALNDINSETGSATVTASKKNYPEFKAGDSIYVEVEADKSTDEDAKDAVLKVTPVSVDALEVGTKPLDITDDTDQWYTFTAKKDGFYEFDVTVSERAAGDTTATHEAWLELYKELFVEGSKIEDEILDLKSGETLAIRLNHNVLNEKDADGKEVDVKSPATVTVKELIPDPLELGKEKAKQVDLKADDKEAHYYSFTAAANAKYTFAWQPADEKQNNAEVTLLEDVRKDREITLGSWTTPYAISAGKVFYIKVKVKNTDTGIAVSGKLCVTADNLNADVLTENKPEDFVLEKDGITERVFRFTAPKAGNYAVITTLGEDKDTDLQYKDYPTINWKYAYSWSDFSGYQTIETPYDYLWSFSAGETRYLRLKIEKNGTIEKTAGTIMIRSVSEEVAEDQPEVTVAKGVTKQYTFKIPESGRYKFKADYDKTNESVYVVYAGSLEQASGRYYRKNSDVTISVTGLKDEAADETVKLYKPALINPDALVVGDNGVDLKAGETKYYEISVTAPKTYELKVTDIKGTVDSKIWYSTDIKDENSGDIEINNTETFISVPKNGKLFIKIKPEDEKQALNCNLKVAERLELKVGSNDINLKAGETAKLIFRAPEKGYYSFQVEGKDLVLDGELSDSFNKFTGLMNAKATRIYELRNEGTAEVKSVTVNAITPIEVTPGSTTPAKEIAAGDEAYYALKTFKSADYLIKIKNAAGKVEDLQVFLNGNDSTDDLKKIDDAEMLEASLSDEAVLRVENVGLNKANVTVELTVDDAVPYEKLPANGITLKKGESTLISFVASEDNRYQISKDNDDVKMTLEKMQDASERPNGYVDITTLDTELRDIVKPTDTVLGKADKLVYRLTYAPDDDRAPETQTVKVTIAKMASKLIEADSTKVDGTWYEFKAADDAVYIFSLEDAYQNLVSDKMNFYAYMTAEDKDSSVNDINGKHEKYEKYLKKDQKVFISLSGLDEDTTYFLKYTAVKAIANINDNTTGTCTLDFNYQNEVKELKFVVKQGGSYEVSAAAFRGEFTVVGLMGKDAEDNDKIALPEFTTDNGRGNATTIDLAADDIVTIKVTAMSSGKSSVSIRIAANSVAETLTVGTEKTGDSSKDKDIYYEFRAETATYAISAAGAPTVTYAVNGGDEIEINGVKFENLNKGDRVVIKIEKQPVDAKYTVKIAKVDDASVISLDSNDTSEKAFEVNTVGETASAANTGVNDYKFTGKEAYVMLKAPKEGYYYIAFESIPVKYKDEDGVDQNNSATMDAEIANAWMNYLNQDEEVKFTFKNSAYDETDPDKALPTAMFRLAIRLETAAAENAIAVEVPKEGTLAANERVTYQFKATEEADYEIDCEKSGCNLYVDGAEVEGEVNPKHLEKDTVMELRIVGNPSAGKYKLTVNKVAPTVLKLDEPSKESILQPGKKAFYEFVSTVTADDGEATYQVYGSELALDVEATGGTVEKSGNYVKATLKKDGKLKLTLTNDTNTSSYPGQTKGVSLTVKEVKFDSIKEADKAVDGSLDVYEQDYYEFTATKAGSYQVYLDGKDMTAAVQLIKFEGEGDNRKLGDPKNVNATEEVTLEIGEKLQITVSAENAKKATYKLTVEDVTKPEVKPTAIADGDTKSDRLYKDEKAVYELTVSKKETYSVYFEGNTCDYIWTRKSEPDADGKTKDDPHGNGKLTSGTFSDPFDCEEGDKITFTVSGAGNYKMSVNAVAFNPPLTLGTKVSKTLKPGETVYYQFTSADTPAAGEESTKYQVYGTNGGWNSDSDDYNYTVEARILHLDEESKVIDPGLGEGWEPSWTGDKDLKQNEILQFRVKRNIDSVSTPFALTVKKVVCDPITLENPVMSGRLTETEDGYAYYEFTSKDTPAEGQTTTSYYVYGTGSFRYMKSSKTADDKIAWPTSWSYYWDDGLALEKDQHVRFRVTGTYNLTIAKQPEVKTIILNTENANKTGKLTKGQKVEFTLKNTADTAATYTMVIDESGKDVDVSYSAYDKQRIILQPNEALTVTITARNDVDDFAFTVKAFTPDALTLGTPSGKMLKAGETVYYQYDIAKDAGGEYLLSVISADENATFTYEKNGAYEAELGQNEVNSLPLDAEDKLLFIARNDSESATSFKLNLQKRPAEDACTALEEKDNTFSLKQGEVKYFKFKVSEDEAKKGTIYVLSIPYVDGVNYQVNGTTNTDKEDIVRPDISDEVTVRAANLSKSVTNKDCSINLKKRETLTLGTAAEKTLVSGDKVYYQYTADAYSKEQDGGPYVLTLAQDTDGVNVSGGCYLNSNNYVEEFNLTKDQVLKLTVEAPSKKTSYKLTLQKKPDDTSLPTTSAVTLKPGEVKYFKYEVKEAGDYALSIPASSGALKYTIKVDGSEYNVYNDISSEIDPEKKHQIIKDLNMVRYVGATIEVTVVNTLLVDAACQIDVQKYPYDEVNPNISGTITKADESKFYKLAGTYAKGSYILKYKDVSVQYSTDKTASKKWSDVPADGKITLTADGSEIYLKISYSGEDSKDYEISFDKK